MKLRLRQLLRRPGRSFSVCWLSLCVALACFVAIGPGGLQRLHLGWCHNDHPFALAAGGHAPHSRAEAGQAGQPSTPELGGVCDLCHDLEWARLTFQGTGGPACSAAPIAVEAQRIDRIDEQVCCVRIALWLRSRAPPRA
ncbi:MAG: hypothetical protein JNL50_07870 [Phycisphaerae bacterium]|nr:hypothetical protein [Phycisphaerae bacterium]